MGGQGLSAELVQQVIAKTDGVPLFVEELTKTVIESMGFVGGDSGRSPLQSLTIPATLHDSLMARLDRIEYRPKRSRRWGPLLGESSLYAVDPRRLARSTT